MEKIDFIVSWVDGNDPKWLAEKRKYDDQVLSNPLELETKGDCRYRDFGLMKYWFRAIEKCAPWVNKVFFVTCGQKLEWLNEDHPKLKLVNHKDFIPSEWLPTFNARTISLNYHRIKELSEHFVLFDDEVFLLQPVTSDFFFRNGNPVLNSWLRYPRGVCDNWWRVLFNDYCIVNNSFDMRKSIWENRKRWFNVKELGVKRARQNLLCYLANKTLPIGGYGHLSHPFLKSTFEEIWNRYPDVMEQTCEQKFRTDNQVNHSLISAWNQAKGCFFPTHERGRGASVCVAPDTIDFACEVIKTRCLPQICVNDSINNVEPDVCSMKLAAAFESVFPDRSSFEK